MVDLIYIINSLPAVSSNDSNTHDFFISILPSIVMGFVTIYTIKSNHTHTEKMSLYGLYNNKRIDAYSDINSSLYICKSYLIQFNDVLKDKDLLENEKRVQLFKILPLIEESYNQFRIDESRVMLYAETEMYKYILEYVSTIDEYTNKLFLEIEGVNNGTKEINDIDVELYDSIIDKLVITSFLLEEEFRKKLIPHDSNSIFKRIKKWLHIGFGGGQF